MDDLYSKLIALLDRSGASYRLIDHPPEGRTDVVSVMRGHDPRCAAKCMVVMAKIGKKTTRHILGVVPGDSLVDLAAIKTLLGATYVAFASPHIAEELSGSALGTVLPFAFSANLELIVDPSVLEIPEIYFNAARLDRSMALKTSDYLAVAKPRLASIAKRPSAPSVASTS